jgi:hypothetical protein
MEATNCVCDGGHPLTMRVGTNNINVQSNNTGGAPHNNIQPTVLANRILRII